MGVVRENINFERGLDPKQAMNLGLMNKWMSIKKGDILIIKRDFGTDSENHLDDNARYNRFRLGDYLEVNIEPNKYSDGCIGFTGYIATDTVRSNDDFFMWGTPLEFDQRLEMLDGLRESQNFERGIKPIKSMKIGQAALDLEFIRNTDWGLNPNFMNDYEIGEVIRDYEGFPVLIIGAEFGGDQGKKYLAITNNANLRGHWMDSPEDAMKKIKQKIRVRNDREKRLIRNNTPKNESVNFQRGMDPKRAMDIGIASMDKKFIDFMERELSWTMSLIHKNEDGIFELRCPAQTSISKEIREAIEKFGWKDKMKVKVLDNQFRVGYHYYLISPRKLKESVNFQRRIDPMDSMKIGRVGEREIRKALDELVQLRGGKYKISNFEDGIEGTYTMDPYNYTTKSFRADNFFVRYYPPQGTSEEDYFTYGYRIKESIMKEKILTSAEEGVKSILSHMTFQR